MFTHSIAVRRTAALILAVLFLALPGCRSGKPPINVGNQPNAPAQPGPAASGEAAPAGEDAPEEEEAGEDSGVNARSEYAPVFSVKGGFLSGEEKLTLSLPAGAPVSARIAYTDDCSEPARGSKSYSAPLTVGAAESYAAEHGGRALVVVCDHLTDAGNLGAIIRSRCE